MENEPKYNHLATAEMSEEENYNQIDGVISNKKPSILDHLRQYQSKPSKPPAERTDRTERTDR